MTEKKPYININYLIGNMYNLIGQNEESLKYYNQHLESLGKNEQLQIIQTKLAYCEICMYKDNAKLKGQLLIKEKNKYSEAEEYFEKSLSLIDELKKIDQHFKKVVIIESKIYFEMSEILRQQRRQEEYEKLFKKGIVCKARYFNNFNHVGILTLKIEITRHYQVMWDHQQSVIYGLKVKKEIEDLNFKQAILNDYIKLLFYLGSTSCGIGDCEKITNWEDEQQKGAISFLEEALIMHKKNENNDSYAASAYFQLLTALQIADRIESDEYKQYFQEFKKLSEDLKNKKFTSFYHLIYGHNLCYQQKYNESINECDEYKKQYGENIKEAFIQPFINKYVCHVILGEYEKCDEPLNQIIENLYEFGYGCISEYNANIYKFFLEGYQLYYKKEDYKKKIELCIEQVDSFLKDHGSIGQTRVRHVQCHLIKYMKCNLESLQYFEEAFEGYLTINNFSLEKSIKYNKTRLKRQQGQYQKNLQKQ